MRVTQIQKEILINYMEEHPSLINAKLGRNYPNGENGNLWQELTDILNASGGSVTKNAEKWRKTWNDMKRDVKEKATRIREQQKQCYSPGVLEERLTPLQERLTALVNRQEETAEEETNTMLNHISDTKVIYPPEVDSTNWHHHHSHVNFKEESEDVPYEPASCDVIVQDGYSTPPRKKSRSLLHDEPSTSTTTGLKEQHRSEKTPGRDHCQTNVTDEVLSHAPSAAALHRLADVAERHLAFEERRLAVEERKALAMEKFVELFFKQHN